MLRLRTFGRLTLGKQDGSGVAIQRLRLALLTLLAHAGDRGLSRDQLIGYLWPESTPDSARHKLDQALYMLRRQLGESLFDGSDPLRLNSSILQADVAEFEHALSRGELVEAVSLYHGQFLDGFYLTEAEEFGRWVESERSRLATRYRSALEQLARRSGEGGELAASVEWWRRLTAVDPLSSRATMGLMEALVAAGDRPAALRQAELYGDLLRRELECEPDPSIASLVEKLRAAPAVPRAFRPPLASSDSSQPTGSVIEPAARGRGYSSAVLVLPAVAALLLLATLALRHRAVEGAVDPSVAQRIVVVPFHVVGADSSLNYLHDGMVDLLAAKLTGEAGPLAVDPRTTISAWRRASSGGTSENQAAEVRLAQSVGAGQILQGEVVRAGSNIVLNGTVRGIDEAKVRARASVSGPVDSLLPLVDQLAASLLALQAGEGEHRLALLTSTSLPALRAYLDGRAAYRRGESGVAMKEFAHALELDSSFALAGLELVAASGWVFTWTINGFPYRLPLGSGGAIGQVDDYQEQWIRAMDLAWKNRNRLRPRDLAVLTALRGPRYPEGRRARELMDTWLDAVQRTPDRAESWYLVGYIMLYQGPAMGIPDAGEQASDAFTRALALDPGFSPPIEGLLELAAQRGDSAEVRRLGAAYLASDSTGPTADYVRWHVAAVTGDSEALQLIRERFISFDRGTLDRIQWTAQVEGVDLDDGDRAMATLIHRSPKDLNVLFFANMYALNRGRPQDALQIMELIRKLAGDRDLYDWYRMIYGAHWDADVAAATESARMIAARTDWDPNDPFIPWGLTQWWLARGDTARALKECERLRSGPSARNPVATRFQIPLLASLVLGVVRQEPGVPDLLARADSFVAEGCCNINAFADLLVAQLHERAGDVPGALAAVRRQRWYYPPEYLSIALREEGRLATLTGDTVGAIAAYRHYLALRSDPDPELRAEAERIRHDLDGLEHGLSGPRHSATP
jgi:DNA-binding SARP family transcriptional activator/TolB-like protein